jgi:hypothetical protein
MLLQISRLYVGEPNFPGVPAKHRRPMPSAHLLRYLRFQYQLPMAWFMCFLWRYVCCLATLAMNRCSPCTPPLSERFVCVCRHGNVAFGSLESYATYGRAAIRSAACSINFNPATCASNAGCVWENVTSGNCQTFSVSCGDQSTQATCDGALGQANSRACM